MDQLIDALITLPPYVIHGAILFILLACGLGLPVPEDLTLFAGGLLSYYGATRISTTILVAFLGILGGDTFIYYLGAHFGRKITKRPFFNRILDAKHLAAVQKYFHRYGAKILFLARFMPGLRAPVFFTAGTLHIPYRKFLLFDGSAALISVPILVYLAYRYGETIDDVIAVITGIKHNILWIVIGFGVFLFLRWLWKISRYRSNLRRPGL